MPAYTVSVPVYGGLPAPAVPRPAARYEAAQTRTEDAAHWRWATSDTAADANDSGVRETLRKRSAYEFKNSGFLNGLVKQLSNDLVGTGPRLQLQADPDKRQAARQVERAFARWARSVGLARKLRVLEKTRVVKGECFALMFSNPAVPNEVKLDLALIGPERVGGAGSDWNRPDTVDGIRYDAAGNPVSYTVHRRSPNDAAWSPGDFDTRPARLVCHWYREDEPGQYRGVPETAPTLLVGAQLRRYGAAVLTAAEAAAMLAGVLKTNGTPPTDELGNPTVQTMDEVNFARGSLLTLPDGWDVSAFSAEQPTTTYEGFSSFKLNETSRPHLAPKNLITGDSSGFNFASGKLDHLPYQSAVWINRDELRERVIDRVFALWVEEAYLLGLIPDGLLPYADWDFDWYWDGFASINPEKDASAAEKRLALGLTTRQELCAEEGKDWEDVMAQQAKELARRRELEAEYGVSLDPAAVAPAGPAPAAPADPEDDPDG